MPKRSAETFGERVRWLRESRRLRQADCAWLCGWGRQRWADIEAGRVSRNPSWQTVQTIARALSVPTDALRVEPERARRRGTKS